MVVLEEIMVYIALHHNTVAQYISTFPIMELCLAAERKPVMRLSRKWWEQPALDILVDKGGACSSAQGVEFLNRRRF